jgi:heme oxygenase
MPENGWRWELRERTAKVHSELDKLIGPFDTVGSYKHYVLGAAAFRSGVEPLLSTTQLPADIAYRPTLIEADVRSDLSDLNLKTPEPVALVAEATRDAILGVLYVVEGSSLGAKLLARRASALGFDGDYGARHLFHQARAAQNWRHYLALLDGVPQLDMKACVGAATSTFEAALVAFRSRAC